MSGKYVLPIGGDEFDKPSGKPEGSEPAKGKYRLPLTGAEERRDKMAGLKGKYQPAPGSDEVGGDPAEPVGEFAKPSVAELERKGASTKAAAQRRGAPHKSSTPR